MYDTNRPLPRRPVGPRPTSRPLTAPHARGTAGASARAFAQQIRDTCDKATRTRRTSDLWALAVAVLVGFLLALDPGGLVSWLTGFHGSLRDRIAGQGIVAVVYLTFTSIGSYRTQRRTNTKRIESQRWDQGAAGEEATSRLLQPLLTEGWHILHDRTIRGSHANLDHVLITPDGRSIIVVDSKSWQRQASPVTAVGGRLYYGARDQTRTINTLLWEAGRVVALMGWEATVHPVIAVHGARVDHSPLHVNMVTVASASTGTADGAASGREGNLLDVLRTFTAGYKGGGAPNPGRARKIADEVGMQFPAYSTT